MKSMINYLLEVSSLPTPLAGISFSICYYNSRKFKTWASTCTSLCGQGVGRNGSRTNAYRHEGVSEARSSGIVAVKFHNYM